MVEMTRYLACASKYLSQDNKNKEYKQSKYSKIWITDESGRCLLKRIPFSAILCILETFAKKNLKNGHQDD